MAQSLKQYVYERPYLTPYQTAFVDDPHRYTLVEASTKVGKTIACLNWIIERAITTGGPGRNYWWVAPVYSQSFIAFSRLKQYLPKEIYVANEAMQKVTLVNGSAIWFKSADKPDNLYGEDVYACVIDEATRCEEEAWYAIRTTLTATRGPVKIIGNVKGRHNWAYKMARRAEVGEDPALGYHRITAWDAVDAGVLDRSEVEQARRDLPEWNFRENYEAVPADDGGNPFGHDAIRRCITGMSSLQPVVWGWDLARARDWTVGIALDKNDRVCRFERFQGDWRQQKQRIATVTGGVRALVDSTGVGDAILADLQAVGGNFEGYHFHFISKQNLMEKLAASIHQGQIGYPADELPHRPLIAELDAFEYHHLPSGVRYEAPQGEHDDCVIALGLAVWHAMSAGVVLVLDRTQYMGPTYTPGSDNPFDLWPMEPDLF